MKIHLAKYEPGRIGGGWSFQDNFYNGLREYMSDYDEADIYFITSPSMVQRDEVQKAKADGKKIVLRIDNAVRNSRNRNTGMTRMYDFAHWADLIVYQSTWAKEYLGKFLNKDGAVILNGVELDLFTGREKNSNILYSRFNRDETKNWEVARYWWSEQYAKTRIGRLVIVGQFSDELKSGNFDFYADEPFDYLGVLDKRNMAKLYSVTGKFLYTYYNDACSNSLIEALVAGCEIVGDEYYRTTGGAAQIMDTFAGFGRDYFSIQRMCDQYKSRMEQL